MVYFYVVIPTTLVTGDIGGALETVWQSLFLSVCGYKTKKLQHRMTSLCKFSWVQLPVVSFSQTCLSFNPSPLSRWWLSAWWAVPGNMNRRIFIFRAVGLSAHRRPCAVQKVASHKQPAPPLTPGTPPPLNKALSAKKPFFDHTHAPRKTSTQTPESISGCWRCGPAMLCSAADVCRVISNSSSRETWFIFTVSECDTGQPKWSVSPSALWARAKSSAETVATSDRACQCLPWLLFHLKKITK